MLNTYRVYLHDPRGRLGVGPTFDAGDDAAAVSEARGLVAGQSAELWNSGRLIGRFSKDGVFTLEGEGQA